jgi:hypothetical protein
MDTLDINEIEDFFMMRDSQMSIYSSELRENFKKLKILVNTYNQELKKRLVLKRKIDLIEFFLSVEKKTLYWIYTFQRVSNPNIKAKLDFYIDKIRAVNKSNITKFIS